MFLCMCSMITCERLMLDLGGGVLMGSLHDFLRNIEGGAKLKRYVSLNKGKGVKK